MIISSKVIVTRCEINVGGNILYRIKKYDEINDTVEINWYFKNKSKLKESLAQRMEIRFNNSERSQRRQRLTNKAIN